MRRTERKAAFLARALCGLLMTLVPVALRFIFEAQVIAEVMAEPHSLTKDLSPAPLPGLRPPPPNKTS